MPVAWRSLRAVGSVLIAAILVLGAIVPAFAAGPGPTRLSDAAVSPRSALTTQTVTFTVAYRNREGSPADWVRVVVGGTDHAMDATGPDDWKREVRFTWSGKLPAGTHAVRFEAMSRDRFSDQLDAGSVTITNPATPAPTATPKPTPAPTAAPTPKPTPKPTAAPTAAPTLTPRPTTAPTDAPRTTDGPTATPTGRPAPTDPTDPTTGPTDPTTGPTDPTDPTATPTDAAGGPGTGSPSPAPSDGSIGGVVPGASTDPGGGTAGGGTTGAPNGGAGGGSGGSGGSGDGGGLTAMIGALGTVAFGRPTFEPLSLALTLATTSTIVGATMAFSLFGRRRRDGEQPESDAIMAAHAASGVAVATAAMTRAPAAVAAMPAPLDAELAMPRWRRPSLMEARKADPIRDAVVVPRLTFDHGLVGPLDGRERRLIRYSVVRLLDTPDELRGAEVGFLDQGDEVQLLEKHGVYWLVLCPDGRQGWIHKMTLGDVVEEPGASTMPTATMPIDAETWTMGDDVDNDVLAAYLESRRRS